MGAGQTTLNNVYNTITGATANSEINDESSDILHKTNPSYENIIQTLDSIFTDMAFSTYIPRHTRKDSSENILDNNEGCMELHGKLKSLFLNIPDGFIERFDKGRMETETGQETGQETEKEKEKNVSDKETKCENLAHFYVTTYLTIQDILRALSPHYIYKDDDSDKMFKSFPVYEEENKSYAESLKLKNKSLRITDMNPCKQRMLMFYYKGNNTNNQFEFGIRNPYTKLIDTDDTKYGIKALKDLYKDKYNPVTQTFDEYTEEMSELYYLHMKDISEDDLRLGRLISIEPNENENSNDQTMEIRSKYNQYVVAVKNIRQHYDEHIQKLNEIILGMIQKIQVNNKKEKTIRKSLTYEEVLTYRKRAKIIIKDLYENCDTLCEKAMNAYDALYETIDGITSDSKMKNLNTQIEEFMTTNIGEIENIKQESKTNTLDGISGFRDVSAKDSSTTTTNMTKNIL